MTLKKTTIPQLPVATSINNSDYYILQQGSVTKRVQQETLVNTIENRDLNPIEKTYAQMTALVSASELISGAKYLITDATVANIDLIVEAIAVNKIHTDAKSPDFPQDVIEYDFGNDVIKWRWDTINDVSVAQDLRNLIGLTLGENLAHVHGGSGLTGIIGDDSTDIITGANCDLNLFRGKNLNFGSNIEFYNPAHLTAGCDILPQSIDPITITADDLLDSCIIRTSINIAVSTEKQKIYDYGGEIRNAGGDPVLIYVDFDDNYTLKTILV